MARSSQFRSRTTSRRRTTWGLGPGLITSQNAVSSSSTFLVGAQTAEATVDGLTIVRIRGMISLSLGLATAAQDGFSGAFGICIVTQNAAGVGVTAMPEPVTDLSWNGWLWHQFFAFQSGVVSSSSNPGPKDMLHIEIDSKAMRKIRVTDNVALIGQVTELGTSTMEVFGATRSLSKLP